MGRDKRYIGWNTSTDQVEFLLMFSKKKRKEKKILNYFRYIIEQGAIAPICDLLSVQDTKIIQVAFNGLENILKLGQEEAKRMNGQNPYALMVEECLGLDKIENLQNHENMEIYQKAFRLIETYFGVDDDENLPVKFFFFENFFVEKMSFV